MPLTDHHDGSYSGVIDGHTVGAAPTASFRFFQRSADGSPNSALVEVVIGYWGDGTACVGSKADPTFQSHGGNCFKDVSFKLDCTAHGETAATTSVVFVCLLSRGFFRRVFFRWLSVVVSSVLPFVFFRWLRLLVALCQARSRRPLWAGASASLGS